MHGSARFGTEKSWKSRLSMALEKFLFSELRISILERRKSISWAQNFYFLSAEFWTVCLEHRWNGNLSFVCRLSICVTIISEPINAQISFKFWLLLPLGHTLGRFSILLRKFFIFVNIAAYGSKNVKALLLLQITAESFKLFLSCLPNGLHKTTFGIFENWKFNEFYSFSLTWDPMGLKISKGYSSYKSQPKVF